MAAPGRFAALKLLGHETNESIVMFEETVPVGTRWRDRPRPVSLHPGRRCGYVEELSKRSARKT